METIELMRMGERLLVSSGGILCVYLGYKLFSIVPFEKSSDGTFKFPAVGEITMTRVAPGVFFALFGAAILGISLIQGVYVGQPVSVLPPLSSSARIDTMSRPNRGPLNRAAEVAQLKELLKGSIPTEKKNEILQRLDRLATPDDGIIGFYGWQPPPAKDPVTGEMKS